jgi:hypothetical protein
MSRENVDTVRLAYEVAYAQRSVDDVRDAFAEDYVFHSRPEFPGRLSYRADDMPQLWADLDETYTEFSLVPEDFAPVGDYVVVTLRQSARLRASDARIESTIYHVWHVQNGVPQETWGYSTREEALEAVGLRE